ncbi:MAG: transporter substrate-binding domain-containing protein [Fibrobacter sp.]|nr:transporter substrate-binding domain-containing protein [Fibrobacter sp.]
MEKINIKGSADNLFFGAIVLGIVIGMLCGCSTENSSKAMTSYKDLDGKQLIISVSNASYEEEIKAVVPNAKIRYITNYYDTFIMVSQGLGDGAFVFASFEKAMQQTYPNLYCLMTPIEVPVVAGFSEKAQDLRKKFNAYVATAKKEGFFDSLYVKWIRNYGTSTSAFDFDDLKGENGEFVLGVDVVAPPYEYMVGDSYAGFEMEMLYDFSKRSGLKPKIVRTMYNAVVAGLSTGKFDMGVGAYGYTEERALGMSFSDPFFADSVCFMVSRPEDLQKSKPFVDKFKDSFHKNFIQNSRWKNLLKGLGVTLVITVSSVGLGTLLGLLLYILCGKRKSWDKGISFVFDTFESLPILVVLMIAYYVIFGNSSLGGTMVSIIVFGFVFMLATYNMIKLSVQAVPVGQAEAGLALGYTEYQTLFKIVLPQAAKFFLPVYKGNVIAYLKATAVVGYVAVEDLTKVGDIIRSQTFEAFFPLIAVALLYYILARIIIALLDKVAGGKHDKR